MIIEESFFLFIKTYVVAPHLNRLFETIQIGTSLTLVETVQMRGHNICFMKKHKLS